MTTKFHLFSRPALFGAALLALSASAMLLSSCSPGQKKGGNGKVSVAVGLPPIAFIANRIGGDKIDVVTMLPEGRSPHDFAPRPADIRRAAGAKIFLTTGMTFENTVSKPLARNVEISDVTRGVPRRNFDAGDDHGHDEHGDHDHDESALDPHVWLSPANAAAIAANIRDDLSRIDPANAPAYRKNFEALNAQLQAVDAELKRDLAPYAGKEFYVYHPAFGYLADACRLKQHAIELNGREATAVQLAAVIRDAREHGVTVIFVQPQFNPNSARALARQINGEVVALDPLAADLTGNFKTISRALRNGFTRTEKCRE